MQLMVDTLNQLAQAWRTRLIQIEVGHDLNRPDKLVRARYIFSSNAQRIGQHFPRANNRVRWDGPKRLSLRVRKGTANCMIVGNEPALGLLDRQPEQNPLRLSRQLLQHAFELRQKFDAGCVVRVHHHDDTAIRPEIREALEFRGQLVQQGLLFWVGSCKGIHRQVPATAMGMDAKVPSSTS